MMDLLENREVKARKLESIRTPVRLHGRWLFGARALWLAVICLQVFLFAFNLLQPLWGNQILICPFALTCPFDNDQTTMHALQQAQISLTAYGIYATSFGLLSALTFVSLSILLFWRVFDQVAGLLASFGFLLVGSLGLRGDLSRMPPVFQLVWAIQIQLFFLCLGLFLVTFPDGRLTPRWSWLVGCTLFVQGLLFQTNLIFSWPLPLLFLEIVLAYGSPVVLQIYRYRRLFTPVERQQTKWVNSGLVVAIGSLLLAIVVQGFIPATGQWGALFFLACDSVAPAALLLIPVSITMAILRSRLWEIDALINRTLVYGLLTAMLLGTYLLLVFGGQYLLATFLETKNNPVVLVVSTLIVFAFFQPLRSRVQHLMDRRFYRSKYDASKIIADFNTTLRQEVDLDQMSEQLLTVVSHTMQPTHLSLWLCTRKAQEEQEPSDTKVSHV
ncbi:MAG TPA: hypothetical protein VFN35_35250 [Ktedonobacteraceae bacterium]|nr:hypothetical protein [Ktedonobacteraceae bacterium]